jgi:hypothetical protein
MNAQTIALHIKSFIVTSGAIVYQTSNRETFSHAHLENSDRHVSGFPCEGQAVKMSVNATAGPEPLPFCGAAIASYAKNR